MSLHFFLLFIQLAVAANSFREPFRINYNNNNNKNKNQSCGGFEIPFPFHLLDDDYYYYSGTLVRPFHAFSLSCVNSSTLFLNISSQSYRVLHFFPDGVLVDFPNTTTSTCRHYTDLNSFAFPGGEYFGISTDNVLGLYDCEDPSLFGKPGSCLMSGTCDGRAPSCCYPLSDHSAWRPGEGLSVFSQFGCRGFSSWVVLPAGTGKRGIKLEWAVPGNATTCVADADVINATSVRSGIRCQCRDGFVGDGFTTGV